MKIKNSPLIMSLFLLSADAAASENTESIINPSQMTIESEPHEEIDVFL